MSGKAYNEMARKRDSDSGQFTQAYTHDDLHDALDRMGESTTQAVADEVGCAYQTAYEKLREMDDRGIVASRKIGSVRLWTALAMPAEEDDG